MQSAHTRIHTTCTHRLDTYTHARLQLTHAYIHTTYTCIHTLHTCIHTYDLHMHTYTLHMNKCTQYTSYTYTYICSHTRYTYAYTRHGTHVHIPWHIHTCTQTVSDFHLLVYLAINHSSILSLNDDQDGLPALCAAVKARDSGRVSEFMQVCMSAYWCVYIWMRM